MRVLFEKMALRLRATVRQLLVVVGLGARPQIGTGPAHDAWHQRANGAEPGTSRSGQLESSGRAKQKLQAEADPECQGGRTHSDHKGLKP